MGKKPPKKWPADWPEKVSVQPVMDYLVRKGKPPLSDEQLFVLNLICDEAKRTNMPPYISISLRDRIKKIGKPTYILELMGIPTIKCGELQRQRRVWAAERAKLGLSPVKERLAPGWQVACIPKQTPQEAKISDIESEEALVSYAAPEE